MYVFMFALPALLLSIIVGAIALAASAGALWLFVFGDDPWPAAADSVLGGVFLLTVAGLWLGLLAVAFTVGKSQEARSSLSVGHVALAAGATVVLLAVIAGRVMGVSFPGSRSDSVACADACQAEGFAASGMPPRDSGDRTCSCYDAEGREQKRILMSR